VVTFGLFVVLFHLGFQMRVSLSAIAVLASLIALPVVKADSIPPGELYIAERALGVIKSYTTGGQLVDSSLVGELAFPQGVDPLPEN
jgi:hypothetical protein